MNDRNLEMEIPEFLKSENIGKLSGERYENAIRNSTNRKNKRKKARARRKAIRTTFIAGISYTMALLSVFGVEQSKGGEQIINNFCSYANEAGLNKDNIDVKVNFDGVEISIDSIVTDIINDARYGGMSNAEIYIGLANLGGNSFADKYLEVTLKDKIEAKSKAYHEWKLSQYNIEDSRGISR